MRGHPRRHLCSWLLQMRGGGWGVRGEGWGVRGHPLRHLGSWLLPIHPGIRIKKVSSNSSNVECMVSGVERRV